MNLLLWGAETWSLRKMQLDQLEIFIHRSIRQILQILMTKVKEDQIRNEKVREMFYSIACVRNMIAAHQANFIGKMVQGPLNQPSRNMIATCCDHKQQVGRLQMIGKNFMVENLRLQVQDVTTVHIHRLGHSKTGSMKPSTRNIGTNWLIASSTPAHRYQNVQQPEDSSHPGMRAGLPTTTNALLITKKATMTMKTIMTIEMAN
jgi:hypothetical protein